jgi:excisionase family DNA binding protein
MAMEQYYTVAELKELLKISEITILRYIRLGKLKSQKIGRQHRITEKSLRKFLDEQNNQEGNSV